MNYVRGSVQNNRFGDKYFEVYFILDTGGQSDFKSMQDFLKNTEHGSVKGR